MLIDQISRETGVSSELISLIIRTASRRYKTYYIAKRNGGAREINQPTPELKFLQRWIVREIIASLPVGQNVMAYRRQISIAQNAALHVSQNYLLKMDFVNFFPSIKNGDIRLLLQAGLADGSISSELSEDVENIVKIVCRNGELTVGAPSSPSISNAVMFRIDAQLRSKCDELGVVYSRYADDLSFSTNDPNMLHKAHDFVKSTLAENLSPRLSVNDDKTIFTSKKHKRSVTGIILTSNERLSIGRDQKRKIKSLCFQFSKGTLAVSQSSYLRGYLSFVSSVEPTFIESLRQKYGVVLMNQIMNLAPIKRKS